MLGYKGKKNGWEDVEMIQRRNNSGVGLKGSKPKGLKKKLVTYADELVVLHERKSCQREYQVSV